MEKEQKERPRKGERPHVRSGKIEHLAERSQSNREFHRDTHPGTQPGRDTLRLCWRGIFHSAGFSSISWAEARGQCALHTLTHPTGFLSLRGFGRGVQDFKNSMVLPVLPSNPPETQVSQGHFPCLCVFWASMILCVFWSSRVLARHSQRSLSTSWLSLPVGASSSPSQRCRHHVLRVPLPAPSTSGEPADRRASMHWG